MPAFLLRRLLRASASRLTSTGELRPFRLALDEFRTVSICPDDRLHLLVPYSREHAAVIASWVGSAQELFHLAPSTEPPLTAHKVRNWPRPGGVAMTYCDSHGEPTAYGEINPMRNDALHYWLGHIIVAPALRGAGLGSRFMSALFDVAYTDLSARRISLVVFPENMAACRCYERVGMSCCGEEFHRFVSDGPRHRLLRYERSFG
ncbi:MAG: GNAT family N-acetyltransferase [Phycisphaerae bacterium]